MNSSHMPAQVQIKKKKLLKYKRYEFPRFPVDPVEQLGYTACNMTRIKHVLRMNTLITAGQTKGKRKDVIIFN